MRMVLGVDAGGQYRSALAMIERLGLGKGEVHCVNVVAPIQVDGGVPGMGGASGAIARIQEEIRLDGKKELEEAMKLVGEMGGEVSGHQAFGDPCEELMDYADRVEADAIAICSDTHGYWDTVFFGSVAKGLVAGAAQSVLVVKGEVGASGEVKSLVATDHSEYADRVLGGVGEYGVRKGVILSAYGAIKRIAPKYLEAVSGLARDGEEILREELRQKNVALAGKIGGVFETRELGGDPEKLILEVADEIGADLIVMGAQGHGFLSRVAVGSVSFEVVMNSSRSVLVLR